MTPPLDRRIAIAVTGASGSIYAEVLLNFLLQTVSRVYLIASHSGIAVARHELSGGIEKNTLLRVLSGELNDEEKNVLRVLRVDDLFAPIASGSSVATDMVIIPCSMGTLARVAHGFSSNLIERSADVMLKEKKRLIVVPRETPLSSIHLENMLKLSQAGAHIIPAMPGFYNQPQSMDEIIHFMVGKVVDALGIDHEFFRRWNSRMR